VIIRTDGARTLEQVKILPEAMCQWLCESLMATGTTMREGCTRVDVDERLADPDRIP